MATSSRFLSILLAGVVSISLVSPLRADTRLHRASVYGKHFMVAFPKSPWGSQNVGVMVASTPAQSLLVTPTQGPTKTTISLPTMDTTFFYQGSFSIEGTEQIVRKHKGTRIEAEHPIKMIGQYGFPATAGTFDILPVESWGQEYYVACAPEGTNSDYTNYPAVYSIPEILIIAYYPNTSVSIFPTTATAKGNQPGDRITIALDSADTYLLTSAGSPTATVPAENVCEADFSGTLITSSRPVGIVVAQTHTSYPCGNNECGDYGVEWLPPTSNLDTMYLLTPTVHRNGDIVGEGTRIVILKDNTNLWVTTSDGREHFVGVFNQEAVIHENQFSALNYPLPLVVHANNPFLPLLSTTYPADCGNGSPGSEDWTFSMTYPPGVNTWSDDFPLLVGTTSVKNIANIYFHEADKSRLFLNDTSFAVRYPQYTKLPYGLAWAIDSQFVEGVHYRIRGVNGATAGGTMFGHGTANFSANDGKPKQIMSPLVVKSYGHGFGGASTAVFLPDTLAPRDTISFSCGYWDVTATDDEIDPPASGLASIDLVSEHGADSSYNVQFNPPPVFDQGLLAQLEYGIDVVNLSLPARAVLRVRDQAGNERDTTLLYNPVRIVPSQTTLNVGAVHAGDFTTTSVTLRNEGVDPVVFSAMRLRTGTRWSIIAPSPVPPFTINAGDSAVVSLRFSASTATGLECDDDTLLLRTCKEFPIVTMTGCNKRPAISLNSLDFGSLRTDSAQTGEEAGKQGTVQNTGTDDLHVTNMTMVPIVAQGDEDFGTFVIAPSPTNPWVIAPGETKSILITAHPHHSGTRTAALVFESDANPTGTDSIYLTVVGIGPDAVVEPPASAALAQTYPNPTTGAANIRFGARTGARCEVRVFDQLGTTIARIPATEESAGTYAARWDGDGRRSGVYFFEVRDAQNTLRASGRVMVLK